MRRLDVNVAAALAASGVPSSCAGRYSMSYLASSVRASRHALSTRSYPTVALAIGLVTVVWIAVWQELQNLTHNLIRDSQIETSNLATVFEQNVTRTVGEIDRIMIHIRNERLRDASTDWSQLIRDRQTAASKETLQIAVTNALGVLIASSISGSSIAPVDLSDREHIRVHMSRTEDRLFVSKPVLGRVSGKWSIQLTRAYHRADGQFGGVIVVSLDPFLLSRAYEDIDLGAGGGLALIGMDDVLRAGMGRYRGMLGRSMTEKEFSYGPGMRHGDTTLQIDETPHAFRIVATRPVLGAPLIVRVAGRDIFGEAFVRKRNTYLIGGLILTLVIALITIVAVRWRGRHESEIWRMAHHDPLTGLPNRARLSTTLISAYRERKNGKGFNLLLLDLDRFKLVNDTYGHPVGDKLLQAVAERLRKNLRKDDFVARLGGDEFAIFQRDRGSDAASALAGRLVPIISEIYEIEGLRIDIGVSIGVAVGEEDANNAEDLVRAADLALYSAKSNGRNSYRRYQSGMSEAATARQQIENGLKAALEQDQFELHYQPIIDMSTRHIIGFEALIRWHHPERGLVSPGVFIPIAEETGQINQIGKWALRRACFDMAQRPAHLRVAVNLSPIQFKDPSLVDTIRTALSEAGLAPERLEVEITESVLMRSDTLTISHLRSLRELGVRISMDDFGTGYSSLSYLQNYPISCIKIDRSFVMTLGENRSAAAIIRAITTLAASLGMSTVAEGVETFEQCAELRALGCEHAQGYYFSPPRPGSEILPNIKAEVDSVSEAA